MHLFGHMSCCPYPIYVCCYPIHSCYDPYREQEEMINRAYREEVTYRGYPGYPGYPGYHGYQRVPRAVNYEQSQIYNGHEHGKG